MSVPLDRVKAAAMQLVGQTTSALGMWAPVQFPRRPSSDQDVITARMVRGPEIRGTRTFCQDEPLVVTWSIVAPLANRRYGVSLAGTRFFTDASAAPTDAEVRDALVSSIEPRLLPNVSITPGGTGDIVFSSASPGRLYCPMAFGSGASVSITDSADAEITTGNARCLLEFQAYSAGPGLGAQAAIADLICGLDSYDVSQLRHILGIAFEGPAGDVVDLTGLAGTEWESRASVRIPVVLRSYRAVPVESIESISLSTLDLRVDGANVGPAEFTVP